MFSKYIHEKPTAAQKRKEAGKAKTDAGIGRDSQRSSRVKKQ